MLFYPLPFISGGLAKLVLLCVKYDLYLKISCFVINYPTQNLYLDVKNKIFCFQPHTGKYVFIV